jgi:hypothetical protein
MSAAISPEALPGWPRPDIKLEEKTILACLLGKHDKRPLTAVFGQVMLLWETLRHSKELVELLAKVRSLPVGDDWRDAPLIRRYSRPQLGS